MVQFVRVQSPCGLIANGPHTIGALSDGVIGIDGAALVRKLLSITVSSAIWQLMTDNLPGSATMLFLPVLPPLFVLFVARLGFLFMARLAPLVAGD
jgi:hypothetical protein